jgi:hypothetical protein
MIKKLKDIVSSIKLDYLYVLTKGTNGVHAKFIGAPWMGSKKKAIWVPMNLVTNLQGPKQMWVPKRNLFLLVGQLQSQRKALGA